MSSTAMSTNLEDAFERIAITDENEKRISLAPPKKNVRFLLLLLTV